MARRRSFAGERVVLTGASVGIGRALALALAAERARLVLAARDEARLAEVAAACRALGAEAEVVPTDVSSRAACFALVERAVALLGGLDLLLSNAGQTMWTRLEDLKDLSVLEQQMTVNYFGCVWPAVAALPHLRGSRGQIAVMASVAGLTGVPTRTGYAASKHALFGFFDSLRIELAPAGVTVTLIAPDFVRSEIHSRALGADGRPLGTSPIVERAIMSAERCAELTLSAIARRERLAILSWRGRVGRYLRLFAPGFIDGVARRAIERGR